MKSQDQDMPSVSCIIPTFNRGTVLCNTVEMLLNQTVAPAEIILVDQSTSVLKDVREKLQHWESVGKIRWMQQEEPNASMARNRGALAATGNVLLFLDDDIRIADDFVEAHVSNYLDPSVVAVAGQILEGDGAVVYDRGQASSNPELEWMTFPKNFGTRCRTTWMASGNMSVRPPVYFEVGGMDENYFQGAYREETDFAIRFIRRGYRFQFDSKASIYHLAAAGAPSGGTRHANWTKYWFAMYGFWYFVIGCATRSTWLTHVIGGTRYFLLNSYVLRRPWRLPVLTAQFAFTFPLALIRRLRGARTLNLDRRNELAPNSEEEARRESPLQKAASSQN